MGDTHSGILMQPGKLIGESGDRVAGFIGGLSILPANFEAIGQFPAYFVFIVQFIPDLRPLEGRFGQLAAESACIVHEIEKSWTIIMLKGQKLSKAGGNDLCEEGILDKRTPFFLKIVQ